jgi:apolipoprotein N-acyltransferase
MELFRSYVPGLAFPWAFSAIPLANTPSLIQLAYFGTVYAVSAWVVLANVLAARFLAGERLTAIRMNLGAFALLTALSLVRYSTPIAGEPSVIAVGQPGVDMAFSDPADRGPKLHGAVASLYEQARAMEARLLVLPEGVASAGGVMPPTTPFEVEEAPPILFGGSRGTGPMYQSAFAYDGKWGFADKMRLVVFGEYIPARDIFPFLDSFRLPTGNLTPADEVSAIEVAGMTVGPLLCFEAVFYDVGIAQAKNGAQLLAAMCLDDWYAGTAAPEQLRDAGIFRAVETGLPMVRSSSLGWTIVVDQRGRVLSQLPWSATAALRADLLIPEGPDRFPAQEAFPWLFAASWGVPVWLAWRAKQKGRSKPE